MAYANTLSITEAKYKDLVSLCDTLVPKEYHRFYKNIKHDKKTVEDESD